MYRYYLKILSLLRYLWHQLHVFKHHFPRQMAELFFFLRHLLRTKPFTNGGYNIPEPQLIFLVAGTRDPNWFIESGRYGARAIVDTLQTNGIELQTLTSILDFGCGCGRVIRHLPALLPSTVSIYGCDYNDKLIKWCQGNLNIAHFQVNSIKPPLNYSNNAFDMVFALSVFTHLDLESQFQWFAEMARIIRPGGYLYITTRTENSLEQLSPEDLRLFERGELVVHNSHLRGKNMCNAFHPKQFIRQKLATRFGFEIIGYECQGAKGNPPQDTFLLRLIRA